jgi:hemoglobin-like flavoprotein
VRRAPDAYRKTRQRIAPFRTLGDLRGIAVHTVRLAGPTGLPDAASDIRIILRETNAQSIPFSCRGSPSQANPTMNRDQIRLVRSSWPSVVAQLNAVTLSFYAHLFKIDESAARLFAGVDMDSQRVKLAQSLGVMVRALDDVDCLLPVLAALGKRHASYGVEDHHFDSVGAALLRALADVLGDTLTRDVRDAWANAYALIASVMRRAIERRSQPVGS